MRRSSAHASARATAWATLIFVLTVGAFTPQAHKAITSKYTFNEHVFPVLRERCGSCHFEGGPTPMSLMTHSEAFPWVESIREQLVSQAMPPWYADPLAPGVKGGHTIDAKELDILLTWAAGGAPEGASTPPARMTMGKEWRGGPPEAIFMMPMDYVVPAGVVDAVAEFVIPTGFTTEKWVTAVDVLPGAPSMVRSATVAVDKGQTLLAWVPGEDMIQAPNGTAFRLQPGGKLHVRIQYRKHWQDELVERTDRSAVGLYFGEPAVTGRPIEALSLNGSEAGGSAGSEQILSRPLRVLGVTPVLDRAYAEVSLEALLPSGRRITLMRLRAPRQGWSRRYWLQEPIELPSGTHVTLVTKAAESPARTDADPGQRLQVVLDVLPI